MLVKKTHKYSEFDNAHTRNTFTHKVCQPIQVRKEEVERHIWTVIDISGGV